MAALPLLSADSAEHPQPPTAAADGGPCQPRVVMDPVTLDRWIQELMDCKPLTESEVESLCEKVHLQMLSWPWLGLPFYAPD